MTSRERMLAALRGETPDHVPCAFMLFSALRERCATERQYIEEQLKLGVDVAVHVGHLNHALHGYGMLHPDVTWREWTERDAGGTVFCRRLDTPKGPLTGRVRQYEGWPAPGDFPLMKDWIVPRAEEILVKPEEDLEKLPYLFGPFKDRDIQVLREEAREAKRTAARHGLVLVGGWKGYASPRLQVDPGVMVCDAMAWLSGYVEVMTLSLTRPDVIREYIRIIHEWNLQQIRIYLEVTDADLIIRRGWYETTEFWTPAVYREMIAPTLKAEADLVHQAGRLYGYIMTSAFLPLLDDMLEAGIDVLIGLDPREGKGTDLAVVKRTFAAGKKAIWGGVSGAMTVELGSAEETAEATRQALAVLGPGGGFILSPVDNVRRDTERAWRNTQVLLDTWRRHRGLYHPGKKTCDRLSL